MFSQLKTYLISGLAIAFALLLSYSIILNKKYKNTVELYKIESNNYKASIADKDNRILQYKVTVDGLRYSKDSVDIRLVKLLDELKIKDNKIKQLQYTKDVVQKVDTLIFRDTLFVNKYLNIDTTLNYKWYKLNLKLKAPSTIIVDPKFTLERIIGFTPKKETIKPPKIWPLRIFQKKHIVCEIIINDKNPYVENVESKFIEIIK